MPLSADREANRSGAGPRRFHPFPEMEAGVPQVLLMRGRDGRAPRPGRVPVGLRGAADEAEPAFHRLPVLFQDAGVTGGRWISQGTMTTASPHPEDPLVKAMNSALVTSGPGEGEMLTTTPLSHWSARTSLSHFAVKPATSKR